MTLRTHRLRIAARVLHRTRLRAGYDWWAHDTMDDYYEDEPRDLTCSHCSGTGGDPWNDGITPCEYCDGEGYEWWN